ncbi:hypothetical protein CO051_05970 [Candidatus Roizmanbacteria bacterium CG_4_9_14_0_2_um_filter_39_13]|uniref:O-antigen ligase-related domain-containing protein n=2 Tax=Candidatus Roizmaniibacteriota TaxID=1752723 RepID=A0A2M8EWZ7_9BACT|nr:MAG: hypothetical protein COY15_04435 [Candidatus Roizmanbacteria bacterium CG_4_10_14_0_2_um_filter_39_12]PJC30369.1 MAG: hypothetical protein CO051_05970 [Candidatus Roizmanbacteria bacterium CG_4_9_14_0_2_um_filter_39_13]PJE61358.1 MAG: hypothetical protein COU87_05050 [Candidatus Roizmanbacteria bacterium CG10_big_fil_rev_8_21_14_0_10_39_12]
MQKLSKLLKWLDIHLLKVLVIGFIFLIPLYPKLPVRMVNYTYIAIRVEDFYMVLVGLAIAIQFFRKKMEIPWKILYLFLLYWGAVFLSFIWGYYFQKTVIIDHLGFLHSARRIEYMLIFFVAYSTIKSKKDFFLYLKLIFSVLAIVSLYGFGQKFMGWPAVQTMNPEYAKGYILVLESWSRISSTFAGHYDLSAYIILLMPILIGYFLYTESKKYFILFLLSLGTLVLAGSRASYIAYLFSITVFLVMMRKFKLLAIILIATAVLTPLSDNLANRLTRTFQQTKVFVDSETGQTFVARNMTPDDLPPGDFGSGSNLSTVGSGIPVVVDTDTEYVARQKIREDLLQEGKKSGKTYSPEEINSAVDLVFLRQIPIIKYLPDISISTRLQVSWPRAFHAFWRNPLLGSGPSSLGEATDGDYLRWLGETGLLGTLLFLAILGSIIMPIFKHTKKMQQKYAYIFYGFLFGFVGLFINAGYIDLFEASKLAYMFWLLAGIFFASSKLFVQKKSVGKLKI